MKLKKHFTLDIEQNKVNTFLASSTSQAFFVKPIDMNKLLIFLLVAAASTTSRAQNEESNITKALKSFKVIPDMITSDVPEALKITFNSGAVVNMGNIIYPSQAKDQPMVDWNADENAYYLLVCADPDAPYPEDPFLSELNTWMVGNIPGKNILSGDVLIEYVGSAPPRGADLNRYVFLLYKQPKRIEFEEKPIDKYTIEGRSNFSVNAFASKYDLGEPVGAEFYLSEYDDYVLDLYGQLQCCFELNKPE
ncbi:protein D3-like [Eupeodes corollae]|uniref:protein D3-like n=1 Tax=Eupeodes corollae TaxID=290404 RepID=UPI002492E78E|nr:protein D3-like [Eupeodes corollae]